jgi:hypothetical protein
MTEPDLADLPPRLPTTLAELDAARMLLGEQARTALRAPSAARLARILGQVPDAALAAAWKRSLGVYRQELLGELGSGDGQHAEAQRLARAS